MQDELLLQQINRFYNLWRESTLMYEEWSKQRGLSYNSVMALYSIHEHRDCCTQTVISRQWLLPKQTIHTILKDFERRGLIVLAPMPSDKRGRLIVPTPSGAEYARQIATELREFELYVVRRMGLPEITALNDGLARFTALFHEAEGGIHAE